MTTVGTVAVKLIADSHGMERGVGQATRSLARLAMRMDDQAKTFDMSSQAARVWKAEQQGAAAEAVALARSTLESLEATKRDAEAKREAARIIEQMRTPLERHQKEVGRLQELLGQGHLTQKAYTRAVFDSAKSHGVAAKGIDHATRATLRAHQAKEPMIAGWRRLARTAASLGSQLLLLAGGGGLAALARSGFAAADATSTVADRLGASARALARWEHAAELASMRTDQLHTALQAMTRRLGAAAAGGGPALAIWIWRINPK